MAEKKKTDRNKRTITNKELIENAKRASKRYGIKPTKKTGDSLRDIAVF